VGADLTLPGGEHLSSIAYTLTNGTSTYTGTYAVGDASTISFAIGGVAAGSGYSLAIHGTTDDGKDICSYPAPGDPLSSSITVTNRATTLVTLNMQCLSTAGLDSGSVLTSAVQSNCPVWNTIVVNPENLTLSGGNVNEGGVPGSTAIYPGTTATSAVIVSGQSAVLVASATGPNQSALAFNWSATAGTIGSPAGMLDPNSTAQPNGQSATNQTIYTCPPTGSGTYTITMQVSDGPVPEAGGCDPSFTTGTVSITCLPPPVPCSPVGSGCADGTQVCAANGTCVPARFSVVVLGNTDGGTISSGSFLPISVQEFDLEGGTVGSPLVLPGVSSAGQQAISLQGDNVTEGDITASVSGGYLVTAGWNVAPGSTAGAGTQGVVARIDSSGHVDTSTVVPGAFSPILSIRSAVTNDGTGFWISGASTNTAPGNTGGVWWVPFGNTGSDDQLLSMPNGTPNVYSRWVRITQGMLFAGFDGVPRYISFLGNLPTTGTVSPITLGGNSDGFATWAGPRPSPYGFVMFNLFGNTTGPDTIYIADDGITPDGTGDTAGTGAASTGGGGLSKWSWDQATGWSQVWSVSAGNWAADAGIVSGAAIGFRGLAGYATGTTVTLMATTASTAADPNSLAVVFVDNRTGMPPSPSIVASSGPNQVFRGVAVTPQ
jgi:hypothetical protein